MLPEITAKIGAPRALEVPYRLGYPLGEPDSPGLQRRILRHALRLLEREDTPVLERFEAEA
jgi:hypothetical protein